MKLLAGTLLAIGFVLLAVAAIAYATIPLQNTKRATFDVIVALGYRRMRMAALRLWNGLASWKGFGNTGEGRRPR